MTVPCVIAYPLERAREIARSAGVARIAVFETAAPGAGPGGAEKRVVRQRLAPGMTLELVVCARRSAGEGSGGFDPSCSAEYRE